ncbi:proteasome accessory factor PafA2 family protein [Aestuariimicrobium sp. p3-SID1156]|uniref:proteasome accessory factor PafA2 family protein n=1 Tax=Aestuariimicrobium sp. p3-SID1156 TaxID=2916038 RepID=UPI00223C011B|nr:proteasome accessory factor PafA2 family protein [Aestuariimicrobium sp. p3-SID1156]MCT1460221.1 proteasome accessory factor PafA2 family protein [Aestuariimicrobium sp. p3-SID1156]
MRMVIGSEIEYGIGLASHAPADPVTLSEQVVSRVRGTFQGSSDRMLGNGGRVYVDHAHPEWSGPESVSARDVLTWELAGDSLMEDAAGDQIVLHKNNTDGKGRSYGYHENFLLPRELAWQDIVEQFTGHVVSRVVLVGAGRVGRGQLSDEPGFQTSQRADFMETLVARETTVRRPLVNARDEPHATPARWRRLHQITGDATLAHVATLVKIGASALVLAAIAAGECRVPTLSDPLAAIRAYSRDVSLTMKQPCTDGIARTALQLQSEYWKATRPFTEALEDGREVLDWWGGLIADASHGPAAIVDRVDWAAKHRLITGLMRRRSWDWTDPAVAALDLQWHELSERGLARRLQASGSLVNLASPIAVEHARFDPPTGTRAAVRGALLNRREREVVAADWTSVRLPQQTIALPDPFTGH